MPNKLCVCLLWYAKGPFERGEGLEGDLSPLTRMLMMMMVIAMIIDVVIAIFMIEMGF